MVKSGERGMPVGKQGERWVTIPVTGMTCASCVRRVERALSKREGVAGASVNFAAEVATVEYDPEAISPEDLIGTIEDAGYGTVSPGGEEGADASEDARGRDYRELKGDFVVAAALTVLIFVGSLPHML